MASAAPSCEILTFFQKELLDLSLSTTERKESVKRVDWIANSIGLDECTHHCTHSLLEILIQSTKVLKQNEEFLNDIAEVIIVSCVPLVKSSHFTKITVILNSLFSADETIVRDKGLQLLEALLSHMQFNVQKYFIIQHIAPLYEEYCKAASIPCKISSCAIFTEYCQFFAMSPNAQSHIETFITLCCDDIPAVTRTASSNIKKVLKALDRDTILKYFINNRENVLSKFLQDMQETVRCCTMEGLVELGCKLDVAECEAHVVSKFVKLSDDQNMRIRLKWAQLFTKMAECINRDLMNQYLYPRILVLIRDCDVDVRTAAIKNFASAIKYLDYSQLHETTRPYINDIRRCLDKSIEARASTGDLIVEIAIATKGDMENGTYIIQLLSTLSQDRDKTVRYSVLSRLSDISIALGMNDNTAILLESFHHFSTESQWRLRQSLVESMAKLSAYYGVEFYRKSIETAYLSSFLDPAYAVRNCAAENAKVLSEAFGKEWSVDCFLWSLLNCSNNEVDKDDSLANNLTETKSESLFLQQSNLYRISILHTLEKLSTSSRIETDTVESNFWPIIANTIRFDGVPNVRYSALNALNSLIRQEKISNALLVNEIIPLIEDVAANDSDIDVRYFACKSMDLISTGSRSVDKSS